MGININVNNTYKAFLIITTAFFLIIPIASGKQAIVNSDDWTEVFVGMYYSKFAGSGNAQFISSKEQGMEWMRSYGGRDGEAIYAEGKNPIMTGVRPFLVSRGFSVETMKARGKNLALDLAAEANAQKFIVVDSVYGYNAIAAAPYGLLTKSFVIFADEDNLDEVISLLNLQDAEEVMIYGPVDAEVRDALEKYDPTIINTGNKFRDNIEIVERFMDIQEVNQVTLTQGQIIEEGLFGEAFPNILVGAGRMPDIITDFLNAHAEVKAGVMIGHQGASIASSVKQKTGIKVLIKFARGMAVGGQDNQLLSLEMFEIPVHKGSIKISQARYNRLTQELEIVYENPTEVPVYALAVSHDILLDGELMGSVADERPVFVDKNEKKTVTYPLRMLEHAEEPIKVSSEIFYGEQEGALEKTYSAETELSFIEVLDSSSISLESAVYNKNAKRFEMVIKNDGKDKVYARPRIADISIGGAKEIVSGAQSEISPGEASTVVIYAKLSEKDIQDNSKINVQVFYGSREDALVKSLKERREMAIAASGYLAYAVISIILIALILWQWARKR